MLLDGEEKLGKERRNNRDGGFQRLVESYSAVQYPEKSYLFFFSLRYATIHQKSTALQRYRTKRVRKDTR